MAQEEVATEFSKYREQELSTGYYEEYEVRPGRASPLFQTGISRPGIRYGPDVPGKAWNRMFLADAHVGLPYYRYKRCEDCHAGVAHTSHAARGAITCRQCHGGEPIAAINHYFSRLNPIRRHAYICAKCHQGAGASFAAYVVHELDPFAPDTLRKFPALAVVSWGMIGLLALTFAFFIPHTALWLLREFLGSRRGGRS
jgi:hypothetical protein